MNAYRSYKQESARCSYDCTPGRGDWCQNIDLYHGLIIDNKYGGFGEADIIQSEPERTLTD